MTLNNPETTLAIRTLRIKARVLSKYIDSDRITGDGTDLIRDCLRDHQFDLCALANRLEKELAAENQLMEKND